MTAGTQVIQHGLFHSMFLQIAAQLDWLYMFLIMIIKFILSKLLTPNKIYFTNLRYLLETNNYGQDWVKIPIGPTHNLESLIYVQGGEPFAVGWK